MTEKRFEEDRYIIKQSQIWDTYKNLSITPKLTKHECDVIIAHLNFHKEIITTKSNQLKYVYNKYCKLEKENEQLKSDNRQYGLLVNSLKDENQKLKLRLKDLGVEYY